MEYIKVKLTIEDSHRWPYFWQTPAQKGIWKNVKFYLHEQADEYDYWLVFDKIEQPCEEARVRKGGKIFITAEPPAIKLYNPAFLSQFDTVITCHQGVKHPGKILSHQFQVWHIARPFTALEPQTLDFDYFNTQRFEKNKSLSILTSTKKMLSGHRARTAFAFALKNHFKDSIEIFGVKGFTPKWNTLKNFKYAVVIENSCYPHYWTEKLADAYLAECFPFYYGCPNVSDYFSPNAYRAIDIHRLDEAIYTIEKGTQENLYEKNIAHIHQSKNAVLNQYNLFSLFDSNLIKTVKNQPHETITLYNEHYMNTPARVLFNRMRRFKNRWW